MGIPIPMIMTIIKHFLIASPSFFLKMHLVYDGVADQIFWSPNNNNFLVSRELVNHVPQNSYDPLVEVSFSIKLAAFLADT